MPRKLKYERELKYGERVRVYRNLNNGLISVMNMQGQVVAHVSQILLWEASFNVRKAGREKVLREQRKNVHAFVTGSVFTSMKDILVPFNGQRVIYNPYRFDSFVEHIENVNTFAAPVEYKKVFAAKAVSINKHGLIQIVRA